MTDESEIYVYIVLIEFSSLKYGTLFTIVGTNSSKTSIKILETGEILDLVLNLSYFTSLQSTYFISTFEELNNSLTDFIDFFLFLELTKSYYDNVGYPSDIQYIFIHDYDNFKRGDIVTSVHYNNERGVYDIVVNGIKYYDLEEELYYEALLKLSYNSILSVFNSYENNVKLLTYRYHLLKDIIIKYRKDLMYLLEDNI